MPLNNPASHPVVEFLKGHRSFLLVPHDRADGDALGSALALARALEAQGKRATLLLLSDVSERYRFLFPETAPLILGRNVSLESLPDYEAIILLDTGVRQQLGPLLPLLDRPRSPVVVIDHHEHCDLKVDLAFRDEKSPATGLLVARLLAEFGGLDDPRTAEDLLIAIASDTGGFSYSNTTAECFTWAAELTRRGARPRDIYEKLFLSDSVPRFRLMARTVDRAEIRARDRLVILSIRQEDFRACGADEAHTENLVDQAARLKTMVVAALFVEQPNGIVRISLRSREPFDVHAFAARYGGGGHRHAAGMKVPGTFDDVKSTITRALECGLEKE